MMVSANSLMALYMALELGSLPLYVMAAISRDYAALDRGRAQIFRAGCSGLGDAALWLLADLRLHRLADVRGDRAAAGRRRGRHLPLGALIGLVFVICGLAFKMAAVPFHMWTPDVYEGAPTPVTTFFTAAPKIAAMGLLVRVLMEPFGHFVAEWQQVIVVVSIASMALGVVRRHRTEQHQADDGLFRHRPHRLRAHGPGRRDRRGACWACSSIWRSTSP